VGVGVGVWVGGRVNGGQQHDNSPARSRSDFRVGDFTVPTKPFTGLDIQTKVVRLEPRPALQTSQSCKVEETRLARGFYSFGI